MKMFKHILAVVCTVVVAVTITSSFTISNTFCSAEIIQQTNEKTFVYEDLFYEVLDDGTLMLRGPSDLVYNVKDKKLVVPAEINGKKVTQIRDYAFNGIREIEYLEIPDTITHIGESAFGLCKNLKTIKMGNALKSIGSCAFESTSIEELTLPNSVVKMNWGAFANCASIKSVTIPSGIKTISSRLFMGCTGLEKVTIPDSVTKINNYAFSDCTGLLSISLPHNITTIKDNTFYNCSNLKSVFISNSTKKIEKCAFSRCYKLNDVYYSGTKEQWDEVSISYSNEELKKAIIHYNSTDSDIFENEMKHLSGKCGDNLTWTLNNKGVLNISGTGEMYDYSIYEPTPWNSDDVLSATIENGVTSIGNYAFSENCKSVFIPKSLKYIGEHAFGRSGYSFTENGYAYTDIYYLGSEDEWNKISKPERTDMTLLLSICHFNYNPSHQQEGNKIFGTCGAHLSWNLDENGTLTIRGTGEMYYISGLETIAPWQVLGLLFNRTLPVNAVVIENGVSSIGANAFNSCKDIKSISLSDSVETIEGGAFTGCAGLTAISIPKGITMIEGASGRSGDLWGTFANCTSLTEFKVDGDNQSYKTVDGVLFTKDGTELIAYPAGKQSDKYAIPSGVETVGECAFEGCKNLKNVVIPNGISKMGSYAFADCINLETAIIYEGVTSLNGFTFGKCSNLKKVYIPQSVTTIGDELAPAFVSCDSLSDVYYSGTEEDWLKIKITDEVINNATIHYNYAPDEVPGYSNTRSNIITVPFKERNVDFYWNDDLFSESAFEYNNNLAIASLVLAGAAESKSDEDVKRVLNDMEFKDIMSSENYDCFNVFQPAYIIGSKKITVNDKEKTLISITIRGTTKFADIITDVADGAIGFNSSVLFVQNGLLEYVNKYFNSVDGDDVILWISGHSLGGAVASSLGAYINDAASIGNDLDWNTYRPENIFTYSFAPPSYTTITSILKQHKNIFETINCLDFIPDLGGPKSRHTGIIREFDPFEVRDYANYYKEYTQKDFVPYFSRFPSTDYHACLAYMAFLKSGGEPTTVRPQKRFLLSVCCPVDVEVYDSDGKLLSRVTNNICDENITSDNVICIINGDKKYFIISTDDKYQVKFTGTDNGTMEYSVQKLRSADEIITEEDFITYETVELENGKMFYSEIPSNDDIAEVTLYVVDSETNEPVKSVELDGKETNLTGKGYIWLYIVGAVLIVGVTVILVLISYKKHKKHSFSSRR